ncbi:metalloprotease [Lyophyllum atratum]|nr:metalloprotease [Lyophyllum atratum]
MKFLPILVALLQCGSFVSAAPPNPKEKAPPEGHDHEEMPTCGTAMTESKAAAETHFLSNHLPPSNDTFLVPPSIPVYFHVVAANKTIAGGWVTDAQIRAQMKILNADFAPSKVKFRPVRINRIISKDWFHNVLNGNKQELATKTKYRKGGPGSLNVYLVGLFDKPGLLGFATFPSDYTYYRKDDGIVMKWTTLPGGTSYKHNLGRTLSHEAGHWVGLLHIFQGGCNRSEDYVTDTPAEASEAYGCPKSRNTCPGAGYDPIHNYMDCTDDACKMGFTKGQRTRMRAQLRTYRALKSNLTYECCLGLCVALLSLLGYLGQYCMYINDIQVVHSFSTAPLRVAGTTDNHGHSQ